MTPQVNGMRLLLARIDQIIESDASPDEIRQHIKQAFFAAGYDAPTLGTFTLRITFTNGQTRVLNDWPHRSLINTAITAVHDRRITEITFTRHIDPQRQAEEG